MSEFIKYLYNKIDGIHQKTLKNYIIMHYLFEDESSVKLPVRLSERLKEHEISKVLLILKNYIDNYKEILEYKITDISNIDLDYSLQCILTVSHQAKNTEFFNALKRNFNHLDIKDILVEIVSKLDVKNFEKCSFVNSNEVEVDILNKKNLNIDDLYVAYVFKISVQDIGSNKLGIPNGSIRQNDSIYIKFDVRVSPDVKEYIYLRNVNNQIMDKTRKKIVKNNDSNPPFFC